MSPDPAGVRRGGHQTLQIAAYARAAAQGVSATASDAVWMRFRAHANLPASREIPLLLQLRELSRFPLALGADWRLQAQLITILDGLPGVREAFSSVFVSPSRGLLQEALPRSLRIRPARADRLLARKSRAGLAWKRPAAPGTAGIHGVCL